jgi:cyclase
MRRRFSVWVLIVCASAVLHGAAAWAGEGLTQISDGVYAYVNVKSGSANNRFGANAGIVVGDQGVLVVDTLTSAKEALIFLEDIRSLTDKPIRYVVNTHYHLDHTFGNCLFADMGADIISHANCRRQALLVKDKALETARSFGMDAAALEGTRMVVPNMAFENTMELDLGNREVRLIYNGQGSHTAGSIVVWVPQQKVAFAGDILFTDFHPYMAEGDLAGWSKSLDSLLALGAGKIVPGHGPLSGAKDVKDMKAYLAAFDRNAKSLCAANNDIEQISAEMIKRLPARADGQFLIQANIQARYLTPAPRAK